MKKTVLCVLILILGMGVKAQKFELSAGYGLPSMYGIGNMMISSIFMNGAETIGVMNLDLNFYNENKKLRYGLESSYEYFNYSDSNDKSSTLLYVGPKADYFWSRSENKLRFYSGVSAGLAFYTYKHTGTHNVNETVFGFNITPIGIRYGTDFAVFVETNIGTKGIFQGGVAYVF